MDTQPALITDKERYLAYLPHSGLSNQRIELSNALLLAYMLNRTLIIPPAFLGTVFGWMPREKLTERLDWLTTPKDFHKLCQQPTPGKLASYTQHSRCEEYRHFGTIAWSDLHDFRPLQEAGIKIKFQSIVSMKQIRQDLQIINDDDIYIHHDIQLYDWRLYENKTEAVGLLQNGLNYFDSFAGRRYYKVFLPRHFQRRREKLVYLAGIFGSTRFTIIQPEHKAMRQLIADVLHYRLDTPLGETVNAIVNYLGGKSSFMSVHFRTSDKPFKKEVSANLKQFVKNMTEIVGGGVNDGNSSRACVRIRDDQEQDLTLLGKGVNVYIATDHKDPRGEKSELLPWFEQFPCTTTLSDLPDHLFQPLNKLRDLVSPVRPLKSFLIPIVDAMVAAHARRILTTPRSTFSKYIEELHKAWI
ncbi:hypothetical protein INT47_006591 [Mucor saturninus]|uniref:O-fucosyltransferase family protein n=1 Tax=Mucor saturninus TaxID=64648 RepID=A0A8H7UV24_9FUNG|nr:hypothetical protein INT47_006591 [Mucor saturninus]